jgi:hypothetical protein
MKNKQLIIVTPFKFSNSDFERFEVSFFKNYIDVIILDLSLLIHSSLAKSQYSNEEGFDVVKVSSLKSLVKQLRYIKKNHPNNVFFNCVKVNNLNSLIFNFLLNYFNFNFISFINPGVPIDSFAEEVGLLSKIYLTIKNKGFLAFLTIIYTALIKKLSAYLLNNPDYLIVAGNKYFDSLNIPLDSKTKIIKGSSWDCSRYFRYNEDSNKLKGDPKFIVLLEGITPIGRGDALVDNNIRSFTPENWFPSVCSFLDKLEAISKCETIVAAHPKSKHSANPSYLGFRQVTFNNTFELIRNSNLVIGRNSAALSMAVLMNKPIINIYNNELKDNEVDLRAITNYAYEMGVDAINIDQKDSVYEIEKLFKLNQTKYREYTKNFLTSRDDEKPNYKVVLHEVFNIAA